MTICVLVVLLTLSAENKCNLYLNHLFFLFFLEVMLQLSLCYSSDLATMNTEIRIRWLQIVVRNNFQPDLPRVRHFLLCQVIENFVNQNMLILYVQQACINKEHQNVYILGFCIV